MTPHETNGQPISSTPTVLLGESPDGSPTPDDRDAPAEVDDRPPWPDDADGPRLTFVELIDHEAFGYRAWGTPVGVFLALRMEDLAQLVRWTHATTPGEHEARMEAWEADLREQWEARGYEAGRIASCRCGACPVD